MHSSSLRRLFIILLIALCLPASAHVFEMQGILGDSKQVKLLPKYSGANLIGVDVYELWTDEQVGHAVLARRTYYRFDTQRVTEDREWYYVNGLTSELTLEVENKYETQNWTATPEIAASLDRAARLVANPKATTDELKAMYRSFLGGAFTVKAGPVEREGGSQNKWLSGLQRIDQADFSISRSPKYGNRFTARFAN